MPFSGGQMRLGDLVRITAVPPNVKDRGEYQTRTILERCVGQCFPVIDLQGDWVGLHLGGVVGQLPESEMIYLEPEFLELVSLPATATTSRSAHLLS